MFEKQVFFPATWSELMVNLAKIPKFPIIVVIVSILFITIFWLQSTTPKQDGQLKNAVDFIISLPLYRLQNSNQPQISARSALVLDKATGSIIFSKNPNLRFTPASATKIMTAYVALKNYQLDEVVVVDNERFPSANMGLLAGERITVVSLVYGMLLNSGNDAAYALAKHHKKGLGEFVSQMNKAGRELELTNTGFADPAGLSDDGNFTTTYDLAKLALVALENPTFAKIVATREKTVNDISRNISHSLKNLNKLLWEVPGVNGVKTGFTDRAGGVLVASFEKGEIKLVMVIFKSEDRFADTKQLIEWVLQSRKGQ